MSIIELGYFLAGVFLTIGFFGILVIIDEREAKKKIMKKFNQGRKLSGRRKVKK